MTSDTAFVGQPLQGLSGRFRGGAIFHGVENLFDGHGLSNRVAVLRGVCAGHVVLELAFNIAQ